MFNIPPEVKEEAVNAMREILEKNGVENLPDDFVLGEAFDEAVRIVKKSFGM